MLKIHEPFVDEKLNLIIVRETPQVLRLAERIIALYDVSEPEVMLEVEVLEVQRNSLTNLGIDFPDTLTLTPIAPNSSPSSTGSGSGSTTSTTNSGFTLSTLNHIRASTIGVNTPSIKISLMPISWQIPNCAPVITKKLKSWSVISFPLSRQLEVLTTQDLSPSQFNMWM